MKDGFFSNLCDVLTIGFSHVIIKFDCHLYLFVNFFSVFPTEKLTFGTNDENVEIFCRTHLLGGFPRRLYRRTCLV